jgi:hypothetical protein
MQQMIFIADLIACSTCFGHHYAHHQELESIIQLVAACDRWCLVFKLSVWCGAEGCVSGVRAARNRPSAIKTSVASSWHFISTHVHMKFIKKIGPKNDVSCVSFVKKNESISHQTIDFHLQLNNICNHNSLQFSVSGFTTLLPSTMLCTAITINDTTQTILNTKHFVRCSAADRHKPFQH